ncbi:nonribosomal peptide synthetase MxaA [Nitrospirillum pindoramense]|uniref:MxaA protein n=1 Tax=Nitrospirillum amazonense TaxID=28077 RepID=A0A560GYC5_9PROT|nr:nonribosomal peptide synthetase MxaA [Nitrospirillum amazonense]TWB39035.1 mxaA protein [Nitrospirillum amazonense]
MAARILPIAATLTVLLLGAAQAQPAGDASPDVVVRAERDIGFFTGDLIRADVILTVPAGATLDRASLPVPGPVAYWLDLRDITVVRHGRTITLHLIYQNFYVALDARRMQMPGFPVGLLIGGTAQAVDVPPWTIGVSPLREVAPPVQEDPKAYLQPDRPAGYLDTGRWWTVTGGLAVAALLALLPLAYHRAWGPFRRRPARDFAAAVRHLRRLGARGETETGYLEALLILHRALDGAAGRRVLADDMPAFLNRRPVFTPARAGLEAFFQASRQAFFGSAPAKARQVLPFKDLQVLGRSLAAAERGRP